MGAETYYQVTTVHAETSRLPFYIETFSYSIITLGDAYSLGFPVIKKDPFLLLFALGMPFLVRRTSFSFYEELT